MKIIEEVLNGLYEYTMRGNGGSAVIVTTYLLLSVSTDVHMKLLLLQQPHQIEMDGCTKTVRGNGLVTPLL